MIRKRYNVTNTVAGKVYLKSIASSMKGSINLYVRNCILCDDGTLEEFEQGIMAFMYDDNLIVEEVV